MGTLFLQMDNTQRGASNRVALIYFALTFSNLAAVCTCLPLSPSLPHFLSTCYNPATVPKIINDRGVYYKERAAATYRSLVYTLGLLLVEIPFTLIALTLFTYVDILLRLKVLVLISFFPLPSIPCYFISGLQYEADKFFIFYGYYILVNLVSLSLGQVIAVVAPNLILANALISILFSCFSMFAGFLIVSGQIPPYWYVAV